MEETEDDGQLISEGIVYRAGLSNPGNMTPRPKDAQGPRRGLSANVDPVSALPPGSANEEYIVVAIDVALLQHLQAYRDRVGHVAIRPPTDSELKEWIESRGAADLHPFTQEVRNAVVGKQKITR